MQKSHTDKRIDGVNHSYSYMQQALPNH